MTEALRLISDGWEQITRSPIWLLIAIFSMAFGLLLKWVRCFDNRYIPIAVIGLTTGLYALLGDASKVDNPFPRVILALFGFILGFMVWAAHRFILKKLEKFLPDGFFPPGCFDTTHFHKDKIEQPDKDEKKD